MGLSEKQTSALTTILGKLDNGKLEWALTGGASFILQGLDYNTSDIDIQCSKESAYEIENIFSKYVVEEVHPWETEKMRSHFGRLKIDNVEVEVMGAVQKKVNGDWEEPVDVSEKLTTVDYKNFQAPVLNLQYEAEAYEKLGRNEKANRLRELAERDINLA